MSVIPRDGDSETAVAGISELSLYLSIWEGAQIFSSASNPPPGSACSPFLYLWYFGCRTVISATSATKMTSVQEGYSPQHLLTSTTKLNPQGFYNSCSFILFIFFSKEKKKTKKTKRFGKTVLQEQCNWQKGEHFMNKNWTQSWCVLASAELNRIIQAWPCKVFLYNQWKIR